MCKRTDARAAEMLPCLQHGWKPGTLACLLEDYGDSLPTCIHVFLPLSDQSIMPSGDASKLEPPTSSSSSARYQLNAFAVLNLSNLDLKAGLSYCRGSGVGGSRRCRFCSLELWLNAGGGGTLEFASSDWMEVGIQKRMQAPSPSIRRGSVPAPADSRNCG